MELINFANIYVTINAIALICAIYFWFNNTQSLKGIVYFLLFAVVFEGFLSSYIAKTYGTNFYAIQWFASMCAAYYLFIYVDWFKEKSWIKYLRSFFLLWIGFTLIYNIVFQSYPPVLYILPYKVGMFVVTVLIIKYLYDAVYVDKYREVLKEPLFYFSLGLLFFFVCNFSLLTMVNEVLFNSINNIHQKILQLGNIFLSLGYLGAVLCSKKISQI